MVAEAMTMVAKKITVPTPAKSVAKKIAPPVAPEADADDFNPPEPVFDPPDEQEFEVSWANGTNTLLVKVGATISEDGEIGILWVQDRSRPTVMYKLKDAPPEARTTLLRAVRQAAGICSHCYGAGRVQAEGQHEPEKTCPRCGGSGEEP